jgi:tetratricopeptide (TPR) repeat protein
MNGRNPALGSGHFFPHPAPFSAIIVPADFMNTSGLSTRWPFQLVAAVVAVLFLGVQPGLSQTTHPGHSLISSIPFEILERPLPLRADIGVAREPVTTASAQAQAYYNQGLSYLHSYVWINAARSFNEARRLDADLAMASLGLSYALSGIGASQGAQDANRQAQALASGATVREQLRISLRARQLESMMRPDDASLANAYKRALDEALRQHGSDVELLLLRGHAEATSSDGYGMSSAAGAIAFYEKALAASPGYFAPHHYLTHAYENANRVDRALRHGEVYARLAPAIAHAHHMYGHDLRRVGRMTDAIVEFRKANDLDLASFKTDQISFEYDWNHHHNLDLLGTAYQYLGQMNAANNVLRQSFEMPSLSLTEELNKRAWPVFLLARGRPTDALTAATVLIGHQSALVRAVGHMLAGRTMMTLKQMPNAGRETDAALTELRAAGSAANALAPDLKLLQGEFFLRMGDREKGRGKLRDAVAQLRAEPDPDVWIQTLFSLEGVARAARDTADWPFATEIAEQMRLHDSSYAGTHYALALAAEQRGDRAAARAGYAEAVKLWRGADGNLSELIQARRHLAALSAAPTRRTP